MPGKLIYESIYSNSDSAGRYSYHGYMCKEELYKLLTIAKENGVTGLDINDYIAWIIRNYET